MIAVPALLRSRWLSGHYVGDARPTCRVSIRRGYLDRKRDSDGVWSADWTAIEDFRPLPGIQQVQIETDYDSNGIRTATVDLANVYMREVAGVLGNYHRTEWGWFSPFRAYVAPARTARVVDGAKVVANEWERVLGEAAEVMVEQGYGDQTIRTFSGLIDTATGKSRPTSMTVVARDFGQLLTDCHLFGWNIDPRLRDPVTFVSRDYVKRREASPDAYKRKEAKDLRKHAVIIDDLSELVVMACRWAGFPKRNLRIAKCGVGLRQPVTFSRGEYLIDLVKKVQDVTGFSFYIGTPSADYPMGRPTFRPGNAMYPPQPSEQVRSDMLLTGLDWQHTHEPLAAVIRVRGKDDPDGQTLGGDTLRRVMSTYRPPWHVPRPNTRYSADARVLRHVVHTEELYTTKHQCAIAARMIALQEALAATTASPEIPGHPGLELGDVVGLLDNSSGLNSRALIAKLQSTWQGGRQTTYKSTLGVALMDTPYVVPVVDALGELLREADPDAQGIPAAAVWGFQMPRAGVGATA